MHVTIHINQNAAVWYRLLPVSLAKLNSKVSTSYGDMVWPGRTDHWIVLAVTFNIIAHQLTVISIFLHIFFLACVIAILNYYLF